VKQLEDGYVRFVALRFFFLCAKFCPFDAGMSKLQQMIKWDFLGTRCTLQAMHVYRQYGVLVDNKDAQHAESDWLAVETVQKHVYLHT